MPIFYWKGPGQMEEQDSARTITPELVEPSGVDTEGSVESQEVRYLCVVEGCKKKFKLAALAARHFNSSHSDLVEDKDSWREYVEEYLE